MRAFGRSLEPCVVQHGFDHVGGEVGRVRCRIQFTKKKNRINVVKTSSGNLWTTCVWPVLIHPMKRWRSALSWPPVPAPSYRVSSSSTTMSARLDWIRLSILWGGENQTDKSLYEVNTQTDIQFNVNHRRAPMPKTSRDPPPPRTRLAVMF